LRDRKATAQRPGANPYRKSPSILSAHAIGAASHSHIEDSAATPLLKSNIRKAECYEARQDEPGIERKIEWRHNPHEHGAILSCEDRRADLKSPCPISMTVPGYQMALRQTVPSRPKFLRRAIVKVKDWKGPPFQPCVKSLLERAPDVSRALLRVIVAGTKVKRGGGEGGKVQAVYEDGHFENPLRYRQPPKNNLVF
jgi:hypothetical protein